MANDDSERRSPETDQDNGETRSPGRGLNDVCVVIIGRNEGERLVASIAALLRAGASADRVVYVDSGSSDGYIERAAGTGIHAIGTLAPYTAAKGRNAGARFLLELYPQLFALQFVYGDC